MKKVMMTMMLLFYSGHYVAAMELHEVLKSIAATSEKFAYFTETRTAYFLDKPLVTKGTLEFKAPATMVKRTQEPQQTEQRIEGDLLSISGDTASDNTVSLSSSPELAAGINAIRWILAGNEKALDHDFDITFNHAAHQWTVKLMPKDAEVAEVISSIVVAGEKARVKQIKIMHANGDVTTTDLNEHK